MSYIRIGTKIGNKKSRFYLWDCGHLGMVINHDKYEEGEAYILREWEVKLLVKKLNEYLNERKEFRQWNKKNKV